MASRLCDVAEISFGTSAGTHLVVTLLISCSLFEFTVADIRPSLAQLSNESDKLGICFSDLVN